VAAQDKAVVKVRMSDNGPGFQYWAWPHLGFQQETEKAPHLDCAGAAWVGEESLEADEGVPGVVAKLKCLKAHLCPW